MTAPVTDRPTTDLPRGSMAASARGPVEQVALRVHRGAVRRDPRARSRSPGAAGSAGTTGPDRVRHVRDHRATASRSASTATSPTGRSRRSGRCGSRWRSRAPGDRGPGHPLGRRPPQAPQVLRQGGRPALAVALRRDGPGADEGPLVRAHGLAVRRGADAAAQVRARPDQGPRTSSGSPAPSRCSRRSRSRCPPLLGGLVTGRGRARSPRSSGPRWCGSACCTTSPGRSTRSATRSASGRSSSRDRSGNVWWLAVLSMGESWHNLHHADPTCARHGVLQAARSTPAPGSSSCFEKLGWAYDVRWPRQDQAARVDAGAGAGLMAGVRDASRTDGRGCPSSRQAVAATAGPDDRQGAPRAAARRRPLAVRREGLRRHVGRGDRREGRRLQAGGVRALRRQGGAVRGRRRP